MGRIPSAPSWASCTSAAARQRRAQAKGARSFRAPFASHDEDGFAVHLLVEPLVAPGPRPRTEPGGAREPGALREAEDLLHGMVTVALAAERAPPYAVPF